MSCKILSFPFSVDSYYPNLGPPIPCKVPITPKEVSPLAFPYIKNIFISYFYFIIYIFLIFKFLSFKKLK